ncbi:MAG: CoA transferase, partial [Thermodesulfobacteriota bacterium]
MGADRVYMERFLNNREKEWFLMDVYWVYKKPERMRVVRVTVDVARQLIERFPTRISRDGQRLKIDDGGVVTYADLEDYVTMDDLGVLTAMSKEDLLAGWDGSVDGVFAAAPLAHWRQALDRHKVTFGIVARTEDLPEDAQMNANGVFRAIEGDPDGLRTVDSPVHFDGIDKRPPGRAPEI